MGKKKNLIGQVFGKLLVIAEGPKSSKDTRFYWLCRCDCGIQVIIPTNNLTTGNTKSCGCLKFLPRNEKQKENIGNSGRKYEPRISSARRIWKSYGYRDEYLSINFDSFYELSQQDCFYCGAEPSKKYNYFSKKKDASLFAKENGTFVYNGLDRIDNTKPHTIDNVVPCCWICNRAKNSRTLEEFKQYINNLNVIDIVKKQYNILPLPENIYVVQSVKSAYRTYNKEKSEEEISLEEFYSLSQLPCFYCNEIRSNKVNAPLIDKKSSQKAKEQGWFYYNGLDRIDNNKSHTFENCIPCCYSCNFAKSGLSFDEFISWINKMKKVVEINQLPLNI